MIWPALIIAQAIAFIFLFNFASLLAIVNNAAFNMMRINSIDLFICSVQTLWWPQIFNRNNKPGFKSFLGALHCVKLLHADDHMIDKKKVKWGPEFLFTPFTTKRNQNAVLNQKRKSIGCKSLLQEVSRLFYNIKMTKLRELIIGK